MTDATRAQIQAQIDDLAEADLAMCTALGNMGTIPPITTAMQALMDRIHAQRRGSNKLRRLIGIRLIGSGDDRRRLDDP